MAHIHGVARHIRNFAFFCLGFVIVAFPMLVRAESIAATSQPSWSDVMYGKWPTALAACQSNGALMGGYTQIATSGTGSTVYCTGYKNGQFYPQMTSTSNYPVEGCQTGQNWTYNSATHLCTRPDCVAPATRQSDGTCKATTCPTGYTLNASGVCATTCSIAENSNFSGVYSLTLAEINAGGKFCINGCEAYGPFGTVTTSNGRKTGTFGSYGSPCTAPAGSTTSNDSSPVSVPVDTPAYECAQKGMGSGTVNGVVVCTKADAVETTSKKVDSGTKTEKDGSGNTTSSGSSSKESTSSTSCDASTGQCTTTTTTTTTNPDGTKTINADTSTQDKQSFCEQNPTLVLCKTSNFADSGCVAPPSCDGDAIQCAQANQAWKIKCNMETEPTDDAYKLGKTLAAGGADPAGNPLSSDKITNISISDIVSGAAGQRSLSSSCVASPSFTVMGHTYAFDTTKFCEFASIVGFMMVAVSSILAIRMVTAGA